MWRDSFSDLFSSIRLSSISSVAKLQERVQNRRLLVNMTQDSSPLSMNSETNEKQMSPSMIRRHIRVRQSAERRGFWSRSRCFFRFKIDTMVILAILLCICSVFAVGECDLVPRLHRRLTTISARASIVEYFDMNGVQRDAATMDGRITMVLNIQPQRTCSSGEFRLFDGADKFLGESTCSVYGSPLVEYNVTVQLTLDAFKLKSNEMESNPFDPRIFYILVNRPNEKKCEHNEVYAKVASGTKCTKLDLDWCETHHKWSPKVSCPNGQDVRKSWCYGMMKGEEEKATVEKDIYNVRKCMGTQATDHPYISYGEIDLIPIDSDIKMTKDRRNITVKEPAEPSGIIEYKIDRFDGNPFVGNITITNGQRQYDIEVPVSWFNEPFRAVVHTNTTFSEEYEFFTRHDLFYVETDMEVKITTTCDKKSGTCNQYEAAGDLVEFCKRTKDMICGIKMEGQYREDKIVAKPIFFYGWYTWDGQQFIHGTTAEKEMGLNVVTEATTAGGNGAGITDQCPRCPATTPCAVFTTPAPNTTDDKCDCGNKNSTKGQVWELWIVLGGILALIMEYANRQACITQ